MPLVKCPDCGKMVSSRANLCPNCGCHPDYFEDEIASEMYCYYCGKANKKEY